MYLLMTMSRLRGACLHVCFPLSRGGSPEQLQTSRSPPPDETVKGSDDVHRLLDPQAAWYLRLVEEHRGLGDIELLQRVRRHLHYFANMSQMRIQ